MHKGQFSNTHLANHQLYCLGRVGYRVFKKKDNMYFFYFFIINMFSFFLVFFHKLFLIERRKEEQERQMLEMLHMTGPPGRVSHFWPEYTDHDGTDGWMTGQMDEMMLHVTTTSFTTTQASLLQNRTPQFLTRKKNMKRRSKRRNQNKNNCAVFYKNSIKIY